MVWPYYAYTHRLSPPPPPPNRNPKPHDRQRQTPSPRPLMSDLAKRPPPRNNSRHHTCNYHLRWNKKMETVERIMLHRDVGEFPKKDREKTTLDVGCDCCDVLSTEYYHHTTSTTILRTYIRSTTTSGNTQDGTPTS